MAQQIVGAERRRFGRRPCRVKGWIVPPRQSSIPCVLSDFSEGGARIELEAAAKLPARFDLRVEGLATVVPCELRHSNGRTIGVEFARLDNRRSLSSALATEKFLSWMAEGKGRTGTSGPAADEPTLGAPRENSGHRHPLRAALMVPSDGDRDLGDNARDVADAPLTIDTAVPNGAMMATDVVPSASVGPSVADENSPSGDMAIAPAGPEGFSGAACEPDTDAEAATVRAAAHRPCKFSTISAGVKHLMSSVRPKLVWRAKSRAPGEDGAPDGP